MNPPDQSLDAFAVERRAQRQARWTDRLPPEVVQEILESTAGTRLVAQWLLSLGYEGATDKKVEWLVQSRGGRGGA